MGSAIMRKAVVVPLPEHTFRILKPNGREYWYHQSGRGTPARGKLTRLPGGPHDSEFWAAAATLNGEAAEPGTYDALIAAYKASAKWKRHRDKTRETYDSALRAISERWGPLLIEPPPPHFLTPQKIRKFLDTEYAHRPSMGNLTLKVLKTLLAWGVERGIGRINPAREVSPFELDEANVRPWSEEAIRYALRNAPEPLQRAIVMGRATGQRISDLARMRPADRDGAGIRLTISKLRDREHWCPLSQEAIREIDAWRTPPMTPYIFDGRAFTPPRLQRMFRDWLARPETRLPKDGLRLHGLRATAVCDARMAGYTHQEIATRIGMSIAMVERYSRNIDQRLAAGEQRKVRR